MPSGKSKPQRGLVNPVGYGQLTLVEHALCPLDARRSLVPELVHEAKYAFTDAARHTQLAQARVFCPLGLSAQDEFYLWGLLALSLRQPEAGLEFHATPHYCLRQFGLIDAHSRRGGRQYQQLSSAIERLSVVRYLNNRFYDPTRAEHRRVSFGFFSYSLPSKANSTRAWRFYWDPLFWEFATATGGMLSFDLHLYRQLDPAGRRLFLFVSKVFARRASISLELSQLAVQLLGLAASLIPRDQLAKTRRYLRKLEQYRVLASSTAITKRGRGQYLVTLQRGDHFAVVRPAQPVNVSLDSPLALPLRQLGLEDSSILRTLQAYPARLLQEWIDITLAAQERFGAGFFKRSPAAYLLDNLKHAAQGKRTPPDWWHAVRKAEERQRGEQLRAQRAKRQATPASESEGLTPIASILPHLVWKPS
jgi:hypothetical protein